jgi:hypothetical protein
VELVPRAHRLEERVLDEILGLGGVTGELARDRVQRIEVPDGLVGKPVDFFLLSGKRGEAHEVRRGLSNASNPQVKAAIPKI